MTNATFDSDYPELPQTVKNKTEELAFLLSGDKKKAKEIFEKLSFVVTGVQIGQNLNPEGDKKNEN